MNIFSLFAKLELDSRGYLRNLKTSEEQTTSSANRMQRAIQNFGIATQRVGVSLTSNLTAPIAAVTGAAVAGAVQLGNYADRILDLEQMTGLSTDALQAFEQVAIEAGVSTETLANSARMLTTRLSATGNESLEFADAMAALGVETMNADGGLRNMDELLPDILRNLADMDNTTERNAVAMDVFGRSASDVLPVLGLGSERIDEITQSAIDMGLVLDRDALNAANNFRIAQEQLRDQMGRVAREVGVAVIPIMTDLATFLQNRAVPAFRDVIDRVTRVIDSFQNLSSGVQESIGILVGLFAVGGPLLIAIGRLATAFSTLGISMTAFLGPVGIVALLGVAFVAFRNSLSTNAEAVNEQRLFVQDLMNEYAGYRNQLNITSEREREAAGSRIQTLRDELQDRLDLLEAAAAEETARVQGWLDNPFIKFLLPGFVTFEAGANQGTLAAIEEVRANLALLDADLQTIESGAQVLESITTTPLRSVDNFVTAYGEDIPEAAGATVGALDALGAAFGRNASAFNIADPIAFTIAAIERTEGRITSMSDAFEKFARVGVPMTAEALNLLTQRFEEEAEAASQVETVDAASARRRERAYREWQESRIAGEQLVAQEAANAADEAARADESASRRRTRAYREWQESRIASEQLIADINTERARIDHERTLREQAEADARARAIEEEETRKANALQAAMQYAVSLTSDFTQAVNNFSQQLTNVLGNALSGVGNSVQDMAQLLASGAVLFGSAIGTMISSSVSGAEGIGAGLAEAVLHIVDQLAAMVLATHITAVVMGAQVWNPVLVALGLAGVAAAAFGLDQLRRMGSSISADEGPAPSGSVAALREKRMEVARRRDLATTQAERDRLNKRLARIDERIAEMTRIDSGMEAIESSPTPEPDVRTPSFDSITPRDMGASLGSIPQGVQLAVAVPLLDAANAFGSHVNSFGGYIDRLVTEGIAVNMGAASRTAALR